MSKKSLIICLCILLALVAAICVGVKMLYSGKPQPSEGERAVSHAVVLQAVPSDAALVFCFQNARSGVSMLDDRTMLFHSLLGGNAAFGRFVATLPDSVALKAQPMAVSVHGSETLLPLMILDAGHAQDTTDLKRDILDYAERCGLQAALKDAGAAGFVLVSPSRTLVESSCRHLDTGTSVLDDPYFGPPAFLPGTSSFSPTETWGASSIPCACGRSILIRLSSKALPSGRDSISGKPAPSTTA